MTDFFAAYLLLCLAIILLVVGLIFKHIWIYGISSLSWLFAGLYFLLNSAGAAYVNFLGLFCILVAVAATVMPVIASNKEKEKIVPPVKVSHYDELAEKIEKMRNSVKVKPRDYL